MCLVKNEIGVDCIPSLHKCTILHICIISELMLNKIQEL